LTTCWQYLLLRFHYKKIHCQKRILNIYLFIYLFIEHLSVEPDKVLQYYDTQPIMVHRFVRLQTLETRGSKLCLQRQPIFIIKMQTKVHWWLNGHYYPEDKFERGESMEVVKGLWSDGMTSVSAMNCCTLLVCKA
jgi:hypothetical protein